MNPKIFFETIGDVFSYMEICDSYDALSHEWIRCDAFNDLALRLGIITFTTWRNLHKLIERTFDKNVDRL